MNAQQLLDLIIDTLLKGNQSIEISYNEKLEARQYDLGVEFKSRIVLSIENNELIARMRYDGREVIKSPLDLLELYDYWFDDATSRGWGYITVHNAWLPLYSMCNVIPPVDRRNKPSKIYQWIII